MAPNLLATIHPVYSGVDSQMKWNGSNAPLFIGDQSCFLTSYNYDPYWL